MSHCMTLYISLSSTIRHWSRNTNNTNRNLKLIKNVHDILGFLGLYIITTLDITAVNLIYFFQINLLKLRTSKWGIINTMNEINFPAPACFGGKLRLLKTRYSNKLFICAKDISERDEFLMLSVILKNGSINLIVTGWWTI